MLPEGHARLSCFSTGAPAILGCRARTSASLASASRVQPTPLRYMALLVFQKIEALTVESALLTSISEPDRPGNTCSSCWRTLSGVRPVTYTQEHMVLAAIPAITGGKVTATTISAIRMRVPREIRKYRKNFFIAWGSIFEDN